MAIEGVSALLPAGASSSLLANGMVACGCDAIAQVPLVRWEVHSPSLTATMAYHAHNVVQVTAEAVQEVVPDVVATAAANAERLSETAAAARTEVEKRPATAAASAARGQHAVSSK